MAPFLFDVYDPRGYQVWLTQERYAHIINGHPELSDINLIQQTIESPWFITADNRDDLVENYHKKGIYPRKPYLWVRVVVRRGKVITAHLVGSLKEEKVIWMSGRS